MIIPPRQEGFIRVKLPNSINKRKNNKLLFTPFALKNFKDLCLFEGAIRAHESNP